MDPARSKILWTLAARYERSQAGRTGSAVQDLLVDYEELLREAGCSRGEERMCGERDLSDAEDREILTIERHRRTSLPLKIRFSRARENALFEWLQTPSPSARRTALAQIFQGNSSRDVPAPWQENWKAYCLNLAESAETGASIAPFSRGDSEEIREILALLPALLAWPSESLRRFASSKLCGNSKRLDALHAKLNHCLAQITGNHIGSLEDLGILENERTLILHGPLKLHFLEGTLDLGLLTAPVRIDRRDLRRARLETSALQCFTVENLSMLHELAGKNSDILLASSGSEGGFAHSAIVEFLQALPEFLTCKHAGDSDPKGFEILCNLRARVGRPIISVGMSFNGSCYEDPLTAAEQKTIIQLLQSPLLTPEEKIELTAMQAAGHKGRFEQEARDLPI